MFTQQDIDQIKARGLSVEMVEKQIENFRNGLKPGQEVVTSGGIYGKIKEVDNGIVVLEIAHNVNVRVDISVVYASPAAMQQQG